MGSMGDISVAINELKVKVNLLDTVVDFLGAQQLPTRVSGLNIEVDRISSLPVDYNIDDRLNNIEPKLNDVEHKINILLQYLKVNFEDDLPDDQLNLLINAIDELRPNPYFDDKEVEFKANNIQQGIKGLYYLIKDKFGDHWELGLQELKECNPIDYFDFDEETGTILGYLDHGPKDVVIPSEINGVAVITIGNDAFRSNHLISVVIPDSVAEIGDRSFSSNELTSVIIPNSVTEVGEWAFGSNRLTSVVMSDNVTSIEASTFSGNQITEVIIPYGVTEIGEYAFSGNELTEINIPDSVVEIHANAFTSNKLTSLVIPSSVTTIESSTFPGNELTSVNIHDNITSIGGFSFMSNQLTEVIIGNSVTFIGRNAFVFNNLTEVYIPDSVVEIHEDAFDEGVTLLNWEG